MAELFLENLVRQTPIPCPPDPKGVDEGHPAVEGRVGGRHRWSRSAQGGQGQAADLTICAGPDDRRTSR